MWQVAAKAESTARAEVAALRDELKRLQTQLLGRTAEVDALRGRVIGTVEVIETGMIPAARREVLADLRAKANECSTVGEVIDIIDGMQS